MPILLVRHADAIAGGGEIDDSARWLSEAGRERARKVAHMLAPRQLPIVRFVTSPRVRAVQTAELFAQVLGFGGAIEVMPALCFSEPAERAVAALTGVTGLIAAFGHMPTIQQIAFGLTEGASTRPFETSEARYLDGKATWSVSSSEGA